MPSGHPARHHSPTRPSVFSFEIIVPSIARCKSGESNLHEASSIQHSFFASMYAVWAESRDLHVGRSRHVIRLHSVVARASMSHWMDSVHRSPNGDVRLSKYDRPMFEGTDLCSHCPGGIDWCCCDI